MSHKPTVLIRPLEQKDICLLSQWKRLPGWPKNSISIFEDTSKSKGNNIASNNKDVILIAETPDKKPVGLAHLSVMNLPPSMAQYSLAIPDPQKRVGKRGQDLFVLSIGAAFFVYGFRQIFSLVDSDKRETIESCLWGGFRKEKDFSFLGINSSTSSGVIILRTTPIMWMPIWEAKIVSLGLQVPWFKENASWDDLLNMCRTVYQSDEITTSNGREYSQNNEESTGVIANETFLNSPPQKVFG